MRIKSKIIRNDSSIKLFFLCLIAALILFKLNFGNFAIILAITYNLFFFKRSNLVNLKNFAFVFPTVFFIITIVSSILSKKSMEGIGHTDLELLLVVISIVIANHDFNKNTIKNIFNWYYFAAVISNCVLVFFFVIKLIGGSTVDKLVFHNFSAIYDQHPVYYAMFLSLALFYKLGYTKDGKNKLLYFFFNFILIIGIVLCASKAVLAVNFLFYAIFFFLNIKQIKKRIVYAVIIVVTLLSVINISFIKNRFNEGLRFSSEILDFSPTNDFTKKKIFDYEDKSNISDLELRYILGRIGLYHLVKDNKLLIGYGQGDTQDHLDYYYYSYNLGPNWNEGRNLHNQYLHILVMYGLFSLLLFVGYLGYSFYKGIKHRNILHLFFLLMVSFVFIFEVVLVRNKGIIFFYFFNSLFLFKYNSFENSYIRHKGNSQ